MNHERYSVEQLQMHPTGPNCCPNPTSYKVDASIDLTKQGERARCVFSHSPFRNANNCGIFSSLTRAEAKVKEMKEGEHGFGFVRMRAFLSGGQFINASGTRRTGGHRSTCV